MSAIEHLPAADTERAGKGEKFADQRRICGLTRKAFFVALVVALVIIAAAIGGGVGGGISARNREKSSSSPTSVTPTQTSASSSSAISSTTATTTSSSSSATPSETTLNNMTSPYAFAFQGFSEPNYMGKASAIIREKGFYDIGVNAISYVWQTNNTQCCVTFCADEHESTGYRCEPRKRAEASSAFPRVHIWCRGDEGQANANATCS